MTIDQNNNAPDGETVSTVEGTVATVNLTKRKTQKSAASTKPEAKKPVVAKKRKKSRGESATSPRRIKAVEEKQLQALEYRKMAYTYAQIAEVLGYATPQGAYLAIQSALTRIIREPAEDVLKLELERLDAMFSKPYQAATNGDLLAVGACLNIMARKAKLLGLDAPAKVDATVGNKDGQPFKSQVVSDAQVADAMKKAADAF
ncbi:hypothetical protein [Collimonas humicola]|uniref:hypothetical protein n=1 Tax=Collimonas humicola TaxID=2825886 RepID=UPI001B8AF63C|nr:hypothetical protein [Collimonas humicola]